MLAAESIIQALVDNNIRCFKVLELNHSGSLVDQLQLFHNVGMMIATHGSYFKNMVYAMPGSVFIEVAADPHLRKHQPWTLGTDVSDIIFMSSHGHTSAPNCTMPRRYDCDVVVNRTILAATIKDALTAQNNAGCDMLAGMRCETPF